MANRCNNFMIIKRRDGGKLTDKEIAAFIQEDNLGTNTGTKVDGLDGNYYFSYQYVVPVVQDENRWDNNINNWGCKRNGSYDCYVNKDDHEMTISFDTPRSPPDKWCLAVCKKFPELYIRLEYDEPGCGFQGEMGRDAEGKLFDNYREGDAYLHTCNWCEIHYEDGQTQWRDDAEEFLCNKCYKEFLNRYEKKGETSTTGCEKLSKTES